MFLISSLRVIGNLKMPEIVYFIIYTIYAFLI